MNAVLTLYSGLLHAVLGSLEKLFYQLSPATIPVVAVVEAVADLDNHMFF